MQRRVLEECSVVRAPQEAGEDEDLLLVESDEEGLDAEAAALAARRAFALQHDSLFGLDSQSQLAPMPVPAQSAPNQVMSCVLPHVWPPIPCLPSGEWPAGLSARITHLVVQPQTEAESTGAIGLRRLVLACERELCCTLL